MVLSRQSSKAAREGMLRVQAWSDDVRTVRWTALRRRPSALRARIAMVEQPKYAGTIEDAEGASLTNCRPNEGAEECEWDRAFVAVLNAIHAAWSLR